MRKNWTSAVAETADSRSRDAERLGRRRTRNLRETNASHWVWTAVFCYLAGCTQVLEPTSQTKKGSAPVADETSQMDAEPLTDTAVPTKPPTGIPPSSTSSPKADRGDDSGVARVIVEPAKTLFAFRDSATLKIQIPKAMQLFQASQNRLPQSHDEFMTQIIRANNLRLPELPPGQRYVYDPRRGELMVERTTE